MSYVLVEFLLDKTQPVVSSDDVRDFSGVVEDDRVYQVYWAGDARTKGSFYDAKVLYMAETLLKKFVAQVPVLYRQAAMTFNIRQLLHLANTTVIEALAAGPSAAACAPLADACSTPEASDEGDAFASRTSAPPGDASTPEAAEAGVVELGSATDVAGPDTTEASVDATCSDMAMEVNTDPGTASEQGRRDLTLMCCLDELRRLAGSRDNGPPLDKVLKHLYESKSSKDLEDIELSTQDQANSVELLPDKTRATYTKFFEVVCTALISACGGKELQFGHFDFKMVTISTFEVEFPGAESKGCLCHFAQCVIRKVAQLGL
ncbi:hypothetical protein ISCGN_020636 [Ixodes scapularis]